MKSEKLNQELKVLMANKSEANLTVAKVMRISFYIFTFIFLLNLVGIFIINQKVMWYSYIMGTVLLLMPTLLNRKFKGSPTTLKVLFLTFSVLFMLNLSIALSYHIYVLYIYPVAVASIYFEKRTTIITLIATVIQSAISQFIAFFFGYLPDLNFLVFDEVLYYSIIPKLLILLCLGLLIIFLNERTSKLLKDQIKDTEKIIQINNEMILGFAKLVESRDENTGGHIMRTSKYVQLLTQELIRRRIYVNEIDEEFLSDIYLAAPMHDIGKIAIPDRILCKESSLSEDEYEVMKTHTEQGGRIIDQTFNHVGDEKYRKMVHDVTKYHHAKWNGTGYPYGLRGSKIPISARIMSIADVFDALSQDRCYRKALPLETCFQMIQNGRGTDFDPILVDVFLSIKDKISECALTIGAA